VFQIPATIRLSVSLGQSHAGEAAMLETELDGVSHSQPLGCLAPLQRPAEAALSKHFALPLVNGVMSRSTAAFAGYVVVELHDASQLSGKLSGGSHP
jgi:hypothetical protein